MKNAKMVYNQINQLTSDLIGTSLCDDQNYPIMKGTSWDTCEVEINNSGISSALKRRPYRELYSEMQKARSFNLKLIDGALVLLQYKFVNDYIIGHRLGFFPNPDLVDFQENFADYLDDEIYLDVIDPRVVATPMRFDFDKNVTKDIEHPTSHLTVGQYENCRIPVVRPLTPCQFIQFVIRNFYHTAYAKYCDQLTVYSNMFDETIAEKERNIVHMGIY